MMGMVAAWEEMTEVVVARVSWGERRFLQVEVHVEEVGVQVGRWKWRSTWAMWRSVSETRGGSSASTGERAARVREEG